MRSAPSQEAHLPSIGAATGVALLVLALTPGCAARHGASVRLPVTDEAQSAPAFTPEFSWYVRPLPTQGTVQLALYIDAGSRDARPAQAATLAAHALAARLNADARLAPVNAQVTPDASAFVVACEADQVLACAERLTSVLSPSRLTDHELTAAHLHLRDARSAALADATRSAEAAALRALVGPEAGGLFPLGSAEHDQDASAAVVQAYVDAHYGSQRALLLAEGDLPADALEALGRELRGAPHSRQPRASRPLSVTGGVAVDVAHESAASVAIRARNLEHARAIAQLLRDAAFLTGTALPPVDVAAFELRGGALVLLTVPKERLNGSPEETARELAALALRAADAADEQPWHELERRADASDHTVAMTPEGAGTLRALGERWAARQPDETTNEGTALTDDMLGIGITLNGGRADSLDEADPDARTRRIAEATLREALARALQQARPWQAQPQLAAVFALPDSHDESRSSRESLWRTVDATLSNGAQLHVALSPTGGTGVLVAFDGGAGEDGEPVHGRAALTLTALAQRCTRMLGALDRVTVATRIAADRVALWFEDDGAGWARTADVAARCALEHVPDDADLQDAKLALLAALGADGSEARMRGWVAMALSPAQPGRIAPSGPAERLDAIRMGDVLRALEQWRAGARTHVVAFVRAPPARVARRFAPRLVRLKSGEPFDPVRSRVLGDSPRAVAWTGGAPHHARLLVAFRDPVSASDPSALASDLGRAHASAVAARLRSIGLEVIWAAGDGGAYGHWSAVAIETTIDALDGLAPRIEAALRADLTLDATLAELGRARPRSLSEEALRALPNVTQAPPTPAAGPRFVVARPQGIEAIRRQNPR